MNLKAFSHQALIDEAVVAVKRETSATLYVLEVFRELETRKSYLDLGYSSLFDFAVRHCRLSEGSANRRIAAMRLMKDVPTAKEKLESGELTPTNAAKIYSAMRAVPVSPEQKEKIIESCAGLTQKACDETLKEFFPDLDDSVELKLVLPKALAEKFEKLKKLTSHKNPDQSSLKLFEELVTKALEKEEKKITTTATVAVNPEDPAPGERIYIPAELKRQVHTRANHQCQKPGCRSTYLLEIDHILELARGGATTLENLQLLCFHHHQRKTAQVFGRRLSPRNGKTIRYGYGER